MQILFRASNKLMRKNSSIAIRKDLRESQQNLDQLEMIKQSNASNKRRLDYFNEHQPNLRKVLKKYGNMRMI